MSIGPFTMFKPIEFVENHRDRPKGPYEFNLGWPAVDLIPVIHTGINDICVLQADIKDPYWKEESRRDLLRMVFRLEPWIVDALLGSNINFRFYARHPYLIIVGIDSPHVGKLHYTPFCQPYLTFDNLNDMLTAKLIIGDTGMRSPIPEWWIHNGY